ncbi:MAG: aminotransferase class I/II-fold pyridoxal phosphate-dependent enzyme [Candidatus Marinimicrobia bacterium]|nr:aminotransferase class I/II-fold pyridoxal phosphate-dependent enzyme [Candidatus Neomarinimicrobiota bacterium]
MTKIDRLSRRRFIRSTALLSSIFLPGVGRIQAIPAHIQNSRDYEGRLCFNENPLGPAPLAQTAIEETASMAHRYPDYFSTELESTIAGIHGVDADMICVGAGATEVIRLIADAFLNPGDELITATPTYFQMSYDATTNGASTVHIPVDENFVIDLDLVLAAITENTKIISLVNPNNPLATIIHKDDMNAFMNAIPEGVIVVVDEAYHHYVQSEDYESCIQYVQAGLPVIVLRTFSKAYGLAGARIGYSIASQELTDQIDSTQLFGTVSRMSQAAALAAIDDTSHLESSVNLNTMAKIVLANGFASLGLSYIPSESNFMMVDVGIEAAPIRASLANMGYLVRTGWDMPNYLRVSTGTMTEINGFLDALESLLVVGVSGNTEIPQQFALQSISPNPFNARCRIDLSIAEPGQTKLTVYDLLGRNIKSLLNSSLKPGRHEFFWNGKDSFGNPVASGVYYLVLLQGELAATQRITLLK